MDIFKTKNDIPCIFLENECTLVIRILLPNRSNLLLNLQHNILLNI